MGLLVKATETVAPGAAAANQAIQYTDDATNRERFSDEAGNDLGLMMADYQTIASASTTDLASKNSNVVEVTGSVTITSFGGTTGYKQGELVFVRFASALSITYNATSMIIPWMSTGNLAIAAGDTILVRKESDTQAYWRVLAHWKANGMGSRETQQALTDGATVNWDTALGNMATLTLGGNRTMAAPTNLVPGTYILKLSQDATGSRTVTWNSVFKWASGTAPTLSTGANAVDILTFYCDGTNLYGTAQKTFS